MRYAALVAVAVLAGCDLSLTGPDITMWGVRPLDPVPAVYAEWHGKVEECLGATRSFDALEWQVADDMVADGEPLGGRIRGRRITIRLSLVDYAPTVRHELVHYVLRAGNEIHDASGDVPCEGVPVS